MTAMTTSALLQLASLPAMDASAAPEFALRAPLGLPDSGSGEPGATPEPTEQVAPGPEPFAAEGTRRFTIQAGWASDLEDARFMLVGAGAEFYVADGLALAVELNGLDVEQNGPDSGAVNALLLLRWHFVQRERWSVFFDGGAGLLYAGNPVPANGSRFNFTPQAGLGASIALGDDGTRLLVGARWQHISNARTFETNPGRDSLMLWAGLSWGF